MTYIHSDIIPRIKESRKGYPVITITGPRLSGKSTLCRHLFPDYKYVNLEQIINRSMAAGDQIYFSDTGYDRCSDQIHSHIQRRVIPPNDPQRPRCLTLQIIRIILILIYLPKYPIGHVAESSYGQTGNTTIP